MCFTIREYLNNIICDVSFRYGRGIVIPRGNPKFNFCSGIRVVVDIFKFYNTLIIACSKYIILCHPNSRKHNI